MSEPLKIEIIRGPIVVAFLKIDSSPPGQQKITSDQVDMSNKSSAPGQKTVATAPAGGHLETLITVGQRNNAPTSYHPTDHLYCFHIDLKRPDKPFVFEEIVGGGHVTQGGAINLAGNELESWMGNWRDHMRLAGCSWVEGVVDQRPNATDQELVDAILEMRLATL